MRGFSILLVVFCCSCLAGCAKRKPEGALPAMKLAQSSVRRVDAASQPRAVSRPAGRPDHAVQKAAGQKAAGQKAAGQNFVLELEHFLQEVERLTTKVERSKISGSRGVAVKTVPGSALINVVSPQSRRSSR